MLLLLAPGHSGYAPLQPKRPVPEAGPGCAVLGRVGLTSTQVAKRLRGDDPTRRMAADYIGGFLSHFKVFSPFAEQMYKVKEQFDSTSPSIQAALEPKSTETVRKRAGSIRMYSGWFATSAYCDGSPFDEISVFCYLGYLNSERVPATRRSTFRESVNWMGGPLQLRCRGNA